MKKNLKIPTTPFILEELYSARKKRNIAWLFPNHLKQILDFKWRSFTTHKRAFPDFIILGEPKCGTTSLFNYLMQSPDAVPPMCKETHYFDLIVHWNIPWEFPNLDNPHIVERFKNEYRAFFPLMNKFDSSNKFTGEATPGLLRHGGSHEIIKRVLPEKTKFIVILRNPIDEKRSAYYFFRSLHDLNNIKVQSFDDHIEQLDIEKERKRYNDYHKCFNYLSIMVLKSFNFQKKIVNPDNRFPTILDSPCYADLLATWYETFPEKDKLLILSFEEMVKSPQKTVDTILDFLDKPSFKLENIQNYRPHSKYDSSKNPKMKKETREKLSSLFKPYNEKLYEMVGRDFGWD